MNKLCPILLSLFIFPLVITGQALENLPQLLPSSYTVYDIEQGLPQSCISEVYADKKGRLWLNRCDLQVREMLQSKGFYQYDGNEYQEVPMDDPRDSTHYIYFLKGITRTGLLFGTNKENSKCFVLNPDSRHKQFFSFADGERVLHIMAGEGGEINVLTEKGDNRLIYELKDSIKNLLISIPFNKDSSAENYTMTTPAVRSGQSIWLLNGHVEFIEYNIKQNTFSRYAWEDLLPSNFNLIANASEVRNRIRFSVDHLGNPLFFFQELNRFYFFDIASGQLNRMEQLDDFFNLSGRNSFEHPMFYKDNQDNTLVKITRFAQSPEGFVYYASVALLDPQGLLYDYTPIASLAKKGRFKNFVGNYFYSDNFKRNVTIATNGGLIVADLKMDFSIHNFLKGQPARAMAEISPRNFLVINELDQQVLIDSDGNETDLRGSNTHLHSKDQIAGLSQLIPKQDKIWFATNNGQLANFQINNGSLSIFEINKKFEKFNFIRENEVALIDMESGLYIYDLSQKELRPFLSNGSPLNILGPTNELYVSRNNTLWIASLNGLWKIDYREGIAERVGKEDGFKDDRVMCIQEAPDGKLWLGTYSGGIHIYDPESGLVEIIDESNGLSNNTVVGLLQDNEGYWWASTFDGITVLSEDGRALFELSENEGISHREFNRFSYLKTSDGKLLFGTVEGVNLLDPEKIRALYNTEEELQIYLTDITYFDEKTGADIHWQHQTTWPEQIIIPADKRYIEIDFGLSSYNNPDKNNFLFRISRPDRELEESEEARWTSIGYNSELVLNDLHTGDYTILIKAQSYKGQWTEEPIAIKVSVQEFFYKTWWFYLLITIPILLAVWFWIRRLSTEKKRMEAEVEKRTRQIQQDKALIEKQAAKLKELDELKSRFFTNISHEFRTPLTVISGMITQMEQQPDRWRQKGIELIKRNSHQLLTLINQILDLRKLESGTLKANLIRADIIPFLQYLADSFVPMAQSKGIRIHFLPNCSNLEMDYDPDKVLHILSNLLSNAIKYTPGPGDIYFQVDCRLDAGREMLAIQLRDTGKGISPEALPYIFDRFYQVEDISSQKQQGSGIGLALTKELVKLLDGTIQVESKLGAGTTFSLLFPVRREAMIQDEGFEPYHSKKDEPDAPDEVISTIEITEPVTEQITGLPVSSPVDDEPADNDSQQTLLIVEDNPDVRLYLTSCLEQQYQLIYAENGQEGIDSALDQVPDIILSDVMMPVKDGFALCDTLKNDERTSHIPIVMLTAKADFESRMQGLRKRADAYLSKPFEQEELLVILENLLEVRKQLQIKYAGLSTAMDNGGKATHPVFSEVEDAFLKKLKEVVVQHLDDADLSSDFICREMNMSRTNLYRKLKALTDLSISHFVRQVRLQQAKELLLNTDMTISEIAYDTGFTDPKYFSRIFSETFQISPSKFRDR